MKVGLGTSRLVVVAAAALLATAGGAAGPAQATVARNAGSQQQARAVTRSDMLSGIWCLRATRCVAVGGQNSGPLIEAWNGTRWRLELTPTGGGELSDVSCTSASACMAVGGTGSENGFTLAEAWNGHHWRVTPTPVLPAGSFEYGVSCKRGQCVAIGRGMLAELWRSGSWRQIPVTQPPHLYSGELNDVSCVRPSLCLAVGFYFTSVQGNSISLAELWNGTHWRLLSPPGGGFNAISCPNATFCMAVSSTTAATWNGHRWRASKLPGSFGNGPGVANVSCVSASACMAIGFYRARGGHNIAEFWNGNKWRILSAPRPVGLTDVSCTSAGRCVAVGFTQSARTGSATIAERWNGHTWQLLRALNP
jgi:hypothetical protein